MSTENKLSSFKRIPAFRLVAKPLEKEAEELSGFKWASNEIGKRHKLGGDPDFIQEARWPSCPECGSRMSFLAQVDSVSDEYVIADCGMVFVFYCFDCIEAMALVQSY